MAYFRRRYRSRRRTYRRRGYRRTRSTAARRSRREHGKIVTFKRSGGTDDLIITTDGVGLTQNAWNFKLTDLPNYAEFTSLFQSYRLQKVVVRWIPLNGGSGWNGAGSAANLNAGILASAIDYNDSTAQTVGELQEFRTCRVWDVYKPHRRTVYPKVGSMVYLSNVATAYADAKNPWLSTDYPGVPHYSFKLSGTAFPVSTPLGRLQFTYYIQCRDYA